MKQPLIIRDNVHIIISYNGRKLVKSAEQHQDMTDDQIIQKYIKIRNIKDGNRV